MAKLRFTLLLIMLDIGPHSSCLVCSVDTYEVCHVATNLPAYQSSVFDSAVFDFSARKAVDGTRTRDNNSCVLSNHEANPWWTVDLGIPLTITGVIFTNNANAGTRKIDISVSSS